MLWILSVSQVNQIHTTGERYFRNLGNSRIIIHLRDILFIGGQRFQIEPIRKNSIEVKNISNVIRYFRHPLLCDLLAKKQSDGWIVIL